MAKKKKVEKKAEKKDVWNYNFADDFHVRDRIETWLPAKLTQIRNQRENMELEWLDHYRMWAVEHDENHGYDGRAQLFVPEVRKNVEAQARQLTESAFPREDFLDVVPGKSGTFEGANAQHAMRMWQVRQSGLRLKFHVFNRQLAMLGTAVAYVPWHSHKEKVFRKALDKSKKKIKTIREEVEIYNGPDFVPVDLFKWYPINARKADIADEGCFEDKVLNRQQVMAEAKEGNIADVEGVLSTNSEAFGMEELQRDVQRMEDMGLHIGPGGYAGIATVPESQDTKTSDSTFMKTVVYSRMVIPEMAEDGEDPESPIPVKIVLYNNKTVTEIRRNEFFHQRPPYLVGKYILPNPDNFYGEGMPKATRYMQYELNTKAEQVMDSATLALNPLAIIDPAAVGQTSDFNIEPGAVWFMNPQGVKFGEMPDVTQTGYAAMSQLRAQMQEYSDRSPALPPQILNNQRTATQSNIVNSSLQVDNKTFQMNNEIMVLNPLMEMWESLTDQHVDEDQVIMTLGAHSKNWEQKLVSKNMLIGNYRYFWKASSSLQDKAIVAREILDMVKVATAFPPEIFGQLRIDLPEVYRTLWRDVMQLPDAEKVFGGEGVKQTDPEIEHKMLKLGMPISVSPGDKDMDHIQKHEQFIADENLSKEDELLMDQHIEKHRAQAQAKVQAMQRSIAMQQQAQMMQAQAQQQGSKQTASAPGNRTQLSPVAKSGDAGSGIRA